MHKELTVSDRSAPYFYYLGKCNQDQRCQYIVMPLPWGAI